MSERGKKTFLNQNSILLRDLKGNLFTLTEPNEYLGFSYISAYAILFLLEKWYSTKANPKTPMPRATHIKLEITSNIWHFHHPGFSSKKGFRDF
jgi:hypothetical protein